MADQQHNTAPAPIDQPATNPTRSALKWLILFVVWTLGLAIWAIYIALLIAAGVYLS